MPIDIEDRAGHLVHHANPYGTTVRRGGDVESQHTARGDGETRPHVGQRRRAGAIVRDQLPSGVAMPATQRPARKAAKVAA